MSRQSLVNQMLFVAVNLIIASGGFSAVFKGSLHRTVHEAKPVASADAAMQNEVHIGGGEEVSGSPNIQLVSESIIDSRARSVGDTLKININENVGGSRKESIEPDEEPATSKSLLDSIQVTVVDIQPNGNLVVEGIRRRSVSNETRWLRVSGVVRPNDIDSSNSISSQHIAEFNIVYGGG